MKDLLDLQDVVNSIRRDTPLARVPDQMVAEAGFIGVLLLAEPADLWFPWHPCLLFLFFSFSFRSNKAYFNIQQWGLTASADRHSLI